MVTKSVEECLDIYEKAWACYRALELLTIEFSDKFFLLEPHLNMTWSNIEQIVNGLPVASKISQSSEPRITKLVADGRRQFRSFLDQVREDESSLPGYLSEKNKRDLVEHLYMLAKVLAEIEIYLLRLKGWKPWYQRKWFYSIVLLIALFWIYTNLRSYIMRNDLGYQVLSSENGWGKLELNQSITQSKMKVGWTSCISGLGTHAKSRTVLKILPGHNKLSGFCGLDNNSGFNGSIQCEIEQAGQTLFKSEILRDGSRKADFSVSVNSDFEVILLVNDAGDGNGNDHSNWCDLRAT